MKRFYLVALCCLVSWGIFAHERSVEQAAQIAAQFTNQTPSLRNRHMAPCSASTLRLAHTRAKLNSTAPAFYVFNQDNNGGFVVVSGDDFTEDILMYSEEGSFDYETINPNLRFWLNLMQEEISQANAENAVDKLAPADTYTAIRPLLKNAAGTEITWAQGEPYNNLCPIDPYDNTRSATGCVATAAAMIMYKWRYPAQGIGTHNYDWYYCTEYEEKWDEWGEEYYECVAEDSQELSADFGATTYDWDHMKAAYGTGSSTSTQKTAVATLMYHCGVACDMVYGGDFAGGSGSLTDYMGRGFVDYFGYTADKFVSTMSRAEYEDYDGVTYPAAFTPKEYSVSKTTLGNYFHADLEAGRPILMGGVNQYNEGHEFVCDGRDTQGKFHINWGWEDNNNCYTTLSALKPQNEYDRFSSAIDALIGLRPANSTTPVDPTDPETPVDPIAGEEGDFVLVTAASQLAVNDEVIIVNEESSVALSTTQNQNNRGQATVTIVNHTIAVDNSSDVEILTLKAGTTTGTYAFYTGEGYLYAASSSNNYLKTQNTLNANGSWTITISNNNASIIAQGTTTHNDLRYNKNSKIFSCYAANNTQKSVQLYKRVVASDPTDIITVNGEQLEVSGAKKILRNGQLYLMYDGRMYDVRGQRLR